MTQVRQIAYNTIIQIFSKTVIIIIALIGFGLVTRYLGQENFGYFTTIYAFLAIFSIVIDLGLQMTTTKLISDPQENESAILSNALTIRFLTSFSFLIFAAGLAIFFPYPQLVKIGIFIALFGFTASALTSTLTSFFQKKLQMSQIAIAEIVAKAIYLILTIIAIQLDLGLLGILTAAILDSVLIFLITFAFARRQIKIQLSFDAKIWRKILGTTWPVGLTIALNLIYFKGDTFIMSLVRPAEEVGLYGAPYKVLEVLINISYLFLGLILPLLAHAAATNDVRKLKSIIQTTFNFLIIFTIPMIVGGYFVGGPLMVLMAGEEFVISGEIIKILLLATGAIFIASLFGYAVVALNQQKQMIKFYALNAVLSFIGYLIFIPRFSYWGAAWMTVFSEVFILITAAYVLYRHLKFLPNIKLASKAVLGSLIMALPLSVLPGLPFILAVGLGGSIYFIALYLLKGFDRQMILEIIKIKKDEIS